jgi:hypothetical protein
MYNNGTMTFYKNGMRQTPPIGLDYDIIFAIASYNLIKKSIGLEDIKLKWVGDKPVDYLKLKHHQLLKKRLKAKIKIHDVEQQLGASFNKFVKGSYQVKYKFY